LEQIKCNIEAINQNIKRICEKTGKNPEDITVIAVTKTVDADRIIML